jgi:hypothetical protein
MWKVIKQKKLGRWTIQVRDGRGPSGHNGNVHIALESPSGFWVDYPVLYDNGNVAYDKPDAIPPSVKAQVPAFLQKYPYEWRQALPLS